MQIDTPPDDAAPAQRAQFLTLLSRSLAADTFARLVLARYRGTEPDGCANVLRNGLTC